MTSTVEHAADAAILCGGLGTRLRGILGGQPKAMALVGGHPFLEVLVRELAGVGVARVVLCTGVGAEAIEDHFRQGDWGAEVLFSKETTPLGTGGALRLALPLVSTANILVLNGDSRVIGFDWASFLAAGIPRWAVGRLAVVPADGRADTGLIRLGSDGRLDAFAEKQAVAGGAYQNAGTYLLRRSQLERVPPGRSSLEHDLLPAWLPEGLVGYISEGRLIDIGTPERLAQARAEAAPPPMPGRRE